jgi:hypothetical protein
MNQYDVCIVYQNLEAKAPTRCFKSERDRSRDGTLRCTRLKRDGIRGALSDLLPSFLIDGGCVKQQKKPLTHNGMHLIIIIDERRAVYTGREKFH